MSGRAAWDCSSARLLLWPLMLWNISGCTEVPSHSLHAAPCRVTTLGELSAASAAAGRLMRVKKLTLEQEVVSPAVMEAVAAAFPRLTVLNMASLYEGYTAPEELAENLAGLRRPNACNGANSQDTGPLQHIEVLVSNV